MAERGEFELTERDVETFIDRLEQWGDELAPAERALLQLLIARAEAGSDIEAERAATVTPGESLRERTAELLRPILRDRNVAFNPAGWSSWGRGKAGWRPPDMGTLEP